MNALPYSALRVVEIGSRIAVAACGRLLADLGAKVAVVAVSGDVAAARGKWCDRAVSTAGKRLRVVDPAALSDPSRLASLLGHFDVVLLSSDADQLPSRTALRGSLDSRAIVCDITAFGSTGPLAGRFADEVELQALAGVLATTGPADGRPVPIGLPVLEMSAALYAASAIATALHVRRRDRVAQSIEVALFDAGINALTTFMPVHFELRSQRFRHH